MQSCKIAPSIEKQSQVANPAMHWTFNQQISFIYFQVWDSFYDTENKSLLNLVWEFWYSDPKFWWEQRELNSGEQPGMSSTAWRTSPEHTYSHTSVPSHISKSSSVKEQHLIKYQWILVHYKLTKLSINLCIWESAA